VAGEADRAGRVVALLEVDYGVDAFLTELHAEMARALVDERLAAEVERVAAPVPPAPSPPAP